jgi:hypothetical protein
MRGKGRKSLYKTVYGFSKMENEEWMWRIIHYFIIFASCNYHKGTSKNPSPALPTRGGPGRGF